MTDLPASIAALFDEETAAPPPAGWYPLTYGAGFHQMLGPVYGGRRNGRILIGFRCLKRHLNPLGICHGGVTASFCDYQGLCAQKELQYRSFLVPTVSLAIEYLAAIPYGAWVEGQGDMVSNAGNMAFSHFTGRVGSETVFQSRGVFMIRPIPDAVGLELLRNIEAGGIDAASD